MDSYTIVTYHHENNNYIYIYIYIYIGVRELCWNNFGNNDGAKESRIIPEF